MLPLTEAFAPTMDDDRLPENVYVAVATLFRGRSVPTDPHDHRDGEAIAAICAGGFAPAHLR